MSRKRIALALFIASCGGVGRAPSGGASALSSAGATTRTPVGVYAQVDYASLPDKSPAGLQSLYTQLLQDPAVSGIWLGMHWSELNPTSPTDYQFAPIDTLFSVVNAVNADPNTTVPKTVALSVLPGFYSPPWLFGKPYLTSCDKALCAFQTPSSSCGFATFDNYPEKTANGPTQLPLPWSPTYQLYWSEFLSTLYQTYQNQSSWVAMTVGGPTGPSVELMLPSSNDPNDGECGRSPMDLWTALTNGSDQPIVDAWNNATFPTYQNIFKNLTLILTPDNGRLLPNLPSTPLTKSDDLLQLFQNECAWSRANNTDVASCRATTSIIRGFLDSPSDNAASNNALATQVGGMQAKSASSFQSGDVGLTGIKLLSPSPSPGILGGAEFDWPITAGTIGPCVVQPNVLSMGCPTYPDVTRCAGMTPEWAIFEVLATFFAGTPATDLFYDNTQPVLSGSAPMNYVTVRYQDILYSQAAQNICQPVPFDSAPFTSAHYLLQLANWRLSKADMGHAATLPPPPSPSPCTQPYPTCAPGSSCQAGVCTRDLCPGPGCICPGPGCN